MENTTKTIEKPISLIIEESEQIIVNTLNNLNLHPSILKLIVRDVYNNVEQIADNQFNNERTEYEKAILEAQTTETEESTKE